MCTTHVTLYPHYIRYTLPARQQLFGNYVAVSSLLDAYGEEISLNVPNDFDKERW